MTSDTHAAQTSAAAASTRRTNRDGSAPSATPADTGSARRLRRVVRASLLGGLLMAGVLTLGVFGGAREHAITGAALLGFAVGWAMLAILSVRLTTAPQRWAAVPAAALGTTGLALLVLMPDDAALTAAGWVWPPLLLVLAVWMGLEIRGSLRAGTGRVALLAVVATMIAGAVGGMVETVVLASEQRRFAMPGEAYDVGGRRVHLECSGSGSPTVVLQSGLGGAAPGWSRVAPTISRTTRVCVYDRAGQGWSDEPPHPQDGEQAVADLHSALVRAGEPGPFILAGHSTGAAYAMSYAATHPEQIAGLVLLDGTDPYQASPVMGSIAAAGPFALLPSMARLGFPQLFPASFWSDLPGPASDAFKALTTSPRGWGSFRDESAALPAVLSQAQRLTTFDGNPLVVITAEAAQDRPAAHERLTALSTNSSHRFTNETHAGLLDHEHGAEISVRAIHDVVDAVRADSQIDDLTTQTR